MVILYDVCHQPHIGLYLSIPNRIYMSEKSSFVLNIVKRHLGWCQTAQWTAPLIACDTLHERQTGKSRQVWSRWSCKYIFSDSKRNVQGGRHDDVTFWCVVFVLRIESDGSVVLLQTAWLARFSFKLAKAASLNNVIFHKGSKTYLSLHFDCNTFVFSEIEPSGMGLVSLYLCLYPGTISKHSSFFKKQPQSEGNFCFIIKENCIKEPKVNVWNSETTNIA